MVPAPRSHLPRRGLAVVFAGLVVLTLLPLAAPASQAVNLPAAPSAPLGLMAEARVDGTIGLRWEPPQEPGRPHFNRYDILRGDDGNAPTVLGSVASNVTNFSDGAVIAGISYTYQVQAASKKATGPASEPATARPVQVGPLPPDAATGLSGSAAGPDGPVTLTWTPPVATSERPVDGQTVHRTFVGREGSWDAIGFLGPGDSTWQDTWNLQAGTTYIYRIMAYNQEAGSYSEPATVEVPASPSLSAPRDVAAQVDGTCVRLAWSVPEHTGGETIWEYRVYRAPGSDPLELYGTGDYFREFLDCTLEGLTTYWYAVSAVNSAGEGPQSDPVSAETGPQPPKAPSDLAATVEEGPIVRLTWTPPANTPSNPVEGQTVYRVTRGEAGSYGLANLPPEASSWDDGTAAAGVSYTYHVMAYGGGHGGPSASLDVDVPAEMAGTPPSAPRDLTAVATGDCVHLSWSPPAWAGTGGFWGYTVHRAMGSDPFSPQTATADTEFTDCTLAPTGTYRYAISAQNRYGDSPLSDAVEVALVAPPTAPQALAATAGPGVGEVTLAWQPPANDGGAPVTIYEVYATLPAQGGGEFFIGMTQLGAGEGFLSFTDSGLARGETRTYRVAAHNVVGLGPRSDPATASAFDVPSAPLGVAARPGVLGADVFWQEPASDGGLPVLSYTVYRLDGGAPVAVATVDASQGSFHDDGCGLLQPCEYRVAAANLVGEGDLSEPASVVGTGLPREPT